MKTGWFRRSAPQGCDSEIGRSKAAMSIGMSISQPDAHPGEGSSAGCAKYRVPEGNVVPGMLHWLHLTQGIDGMVNLHDGGKSQRPRFQGRSEEHTSELQSLR